MGVKNLSFIIFVRPLQSNPPRSRVSDGHPGYSLSPAVSGTLNAVIFAGSSCFTVLYGRLADVSGSWLPTAAVWTCAGLCAAAAGAAWSGSWKRRMPGTEPDVPDRK